MKAVVCPRYGGPENLVLRDVSDPVPGAGEVLVRVHAAAVNPADWHFMRGDPWFMRLVTGVRRPRDLILGLDFAGTVEAVGSGVTAFVLGDEVFGEVLTGAFAQRVAVKEGRLAHKPSTLDFGLAAAIPVAGLTALQGLRDHGRLQRGERLLINGAGGGVGTFAIQIAKSLGAHVTAVCSAGKADSVRRLGADVVLDYAEVDYTAAHDAYDVILDLAAFRPVRVSMRALARGGRYVLVGGNYGPMVQVLLMGRWLGRSGRRACSFTARARREDLVWLAGMVDDGKLRPVLDRSYALEEVPEAMAYVEEGHAGGKVVIKVLSD